jgi:hypothetical protein
VKLEHVDSIVDFLLPGTGGPTLQPKYGVRGWFWPALSGLCPLIWLVLALLVIAGGVYITYETGKYALPVAVAYVLFVWCLLNNI